MRVNRAGGIFCVAGVEPVSLANCEGNVSQLEVLLSEAECLLSTAVSTGECNTLTKRLGGV
jgi:hypothetical protein